MPKIATFRPRASALLAALALSMLAQTAWSQDSKDIARARERFKEGAALQAAGDFARALDAYKDVALVKSSAQVRFNIATCEEKLGDYVRAMGSYRLALTEATRSNANDIEQAVQKALTELEPRIPRLLVRRGEGAAVAEVTVDGRPLANPSIGVEFQINPGPHQIRATAPDREPVNIDVTLADRDHKAVDLVLKPRAKEAVVGPVAPVVVDGPPVEEPQGNRSMKIAGFAIGGAGVVGLVVSGVFFGMRQSAISTLNGECGASHMSCPAQAASTRDSGATDSTVSTAAFIAGLGAVAIGGTLVIVGTRAKAPKPVTAFAVGPNGFSVRGSF
jgi:hypothetical protein